MKKTLYLLFLLLFVFNHGFTQSTVSKHVSQFDISAPQLDTQKTIWIYLPESYHESNKAFPVVYMFDAQNLFDTERSYAGEWEVDEYLDSKKSKEAIVVGIEHGNDKRIAELTPFVHEMHGGGEGIAFLDFIKYTLKPHIDLCYRTKPASRHTYIIGSSLGGLMACYAVLEYPDTFSNAGVLSPAFWINPEIFEMTMRNMYNPDLRFYFLAGDEESETMIPKIELMISILESKGIPENNIEKVFIEGGQHNEGLWRDSFPMVFDWLMRSE